MRASEDRLQRVLVGEFESPVEGAGEQLGGDLTGADIRFTYHMERRDGRWLITSLSVTGD